MEENTLKATEDRDLAAMAKALHEIEFLAPSEDWNQGADGWAQIARAGAVAAEANDFDEAKKSCKGCHKRWREQFRENENFRRRPLPTLPANAEKGRTDLVMPPPAPAQ
jgi:hypothetical protein